MSAVQLDLFGAVEAKEVVERQRSVDVLVCLRDAMPEALELVLRLENPGRTDSRSPRAGGAWAYCVSNAGVRYEPTETWWPRGGWDRAPSCLTSWDDLAALIGDDPRRTEIAAWVDSLPDPRWRQLTRPYELWPDPGSWHPSYISRDRDAPGWADRRRAWQLVLDLLDDAISRGMGANA